MIAPCTSLIKFARCRPASGLWLALASALACAGAAAGTPPPEPPAPGDHSATKPGPDAAGLRQALDQIAATALDEEERIARIAGLVGTWSDRQAGAGPASSQPLGTHFHSPPAASTGDRVASAAALARQIDDPETRMAWVARFIAANRRLLDTNQPAPIAPPHAPDPGTAARAPAARMSRPAASAPPASTGGPLVADPDFLATEADISRAMEHARGIFGEEARMNWMAEFLALNRDSLRDHENARREFAPPARQTPARLSAPPPGTPQP
jgi:hypothetical protein